jgi:hypothetical protein
MNHRELERIRTVTRHFAALKGLEETVPMGLLLVALGLAWGHVGRQWYLIFLGFCAAGVLIRVLAPRYYRTRFGEVESLGAPREAMAVAALDVPRYFGGIAVPGHLRRVSARRRVSGLLHRLRTHHRPYEPTLWYIAYGFKTFGWPGPVQSARLVLILLATLLIWRWARLSLQSGQAYYPVIASLVLVLAALGGTAAGAWLGLDRSGAGLVVGGGVWIVVGLFDHRSLARALQPRAAPESAAASLPQGERPR